MQIPQSTRQALQNAQGAYAPTIRQTNDSDCPLALVQYTNFDKSGIPHSTNTIFLSPAVIQAIQQAAPVALQGWQGRGQNSQAQSQLVNNQVNQNA